MLRATRAGREIATGRRSSRLALRRTANADMRARPRLLGVCLLGLAVTAASAQPLPVPAPAPRRSPACRRRPRSAQSKAGAGAARASTATGSSCSRSRFPGFGKPGDNDGVRRQAARADRPRQRLPDEHADAGRRFRADRARRPPLRRQDLSAEARPRALRIQSAEPDRAGRPTATRWWCATASWRRRTSIRCRRRRCASCSPTASTC